jgi:2-amino-4-hydroxy-6-hydroxymethyldihydropteridine diphosphokinase
MRAGIAVGSNLGDRRAQLRTAREEILELPEVSAPFLFSALYETEPVGCELGAAKFLNAVLEIGFEGDAERLLQGLRAIEASLGRQRDHVQNAPRTLDLDLLYVGGRVIDRAELQLPHPRMQTRRFVLAPLADIRSELILPEQTESVRTLLERLTDKSTVVRIADEW